MRRVQGGSMSNGLKEENIDKFRAWVSSVEGGLQGSEGAELNREIKSMLISMVYRGKLNRTEVAKAAGIGKSALTKNDVIVKDLEKFESSLRVIGILPKAVTSKPDQQIASTPKRNKSFTEIQRLETQLSRAQQEILVLKAKLERYRELEEVIAELGVL
ncbi:VPA1267 family protein [Vibrio campbellii]|uniref:VPA1267 family protein n=1 Tax=Vibrio campbellii TaxID=680 RepID=UPI0020CA39CA|nr:VPA1267 family protein [Vibrio campbellii]